MAEYTENYVPLIMFKAELTSFVTDGSFILHIKNLTLIAFDKMPET